MVFYETLLNVGDFVGEFLKQATKAKNKIW